MTKVLFISAWYPHRYDAMFGLFVQKHAEAVSLYCEVRVLYVYADKNAKQFEIADNNTHQLKETIVYYPDKSTKTGKFIQFFRAYYKGYKHITAQGFKPDVIHANILTRTGYIAWLLNKWKGIPYVITEHWSRYLPGRNAFNSSAHKLLTQKVLSKASAVLPVSEILKNGMIENGLEHPEYRIVSNVVDDYFYVDKTAVLQSKKRFLHISCFDEQAKNISGILRATARLAKIRDDFELIIIGAGVDFVRICEYAKTLDLKKGMVQFLGEKTPEEVADWYRNCDAVVQFSNYETAGIVIAESLVSGKPVISSRVGIAPQYIDETNGILVDAGDEDALIHAMNVMLENLPDYSNAAIKERFKDTFSYRNIGATIYEIYNSILSKKDK